MDYFILPESCSVPNEEIQAEHELLVSIVNKGRDILRSAPNPDPNLFHLLLEELRMAATAHFAHEEAIMGGCGYPDLANHRAHHANCLTRLKQITDMLLAGEVTPSRFFLDELFDLILDDIIRADSGFKAFIGNSADGK
jgi:hemerythrin-like metal-binding protein